MTAKRQLPLHALPLVPRYPLLYRGAVHIKPPIFRAVVSVQVEQKRRVLGSHTAVPLRPVPLSVDDDTNGGPSVSLEVRALQQCNVLRTATWRAGSVAACPCGLPGSLCQRATQCGEQPRSVGATSRVTSRVRTDEEPHCGRRQQRGHAYA